jgi:lysophospholipase L1-like esterase
MVKLIGKVCSVLQFLVFFICDFRVTVRGGEHDYLNVTNKGLPIRGNGKTIYVLKNGIRHEVASWDYFLSLGFTATDIVKYPDSTIESYPSGDIVQYHESTSVSNSSGGVVSSSPTPNLETEAVNLMTLSKGKKIIAFGDSLTRGYHVSHKTAKPKFHPYVHTLSLMMNYSSQIVEAGLNAELTQHMIGRLPDVLELNPGFKVVIILGGTNDLWGLKNENTSVINIKELHRIALSTGNTTDPIYTVAVTIPQAPPIELNNSPHRRLLNEGIRKFSERCSQRIALLDLESAFNQSVPGNSEKFFGPDEIHLNVHGYDRLGELLHHVMTTYPINPGPFNISCLGETFL